MWQFLQNSQLFLILSLQLSFYKSVLATICVADEPSCVCDALKKVVTCNPTDSHNKITTIPSKIPASVTSLTLDHHAIKDLSGPLSEMSNLKYLSLADNQIDTILYDVFDNMDELQFLKLSHNQLTSLDDDVFEWNPLKLEEIDLRRFSN